MESYGNVLGILSRIIESFIRMVQFGACGFKVARVNGLFGYRMLAKRIISASLDKNLQ
jgi:hypothetical protein